MLVRPQRWLVLSLLLTSTSWAQTLTVDALNSPFVVSAATTFAQVTVAAGGTLLVNAPLTVTGAMTVASSGRVSLAQGLYSLRLDVGGTLTVDSGGAIEADGKGLQAGPAAGFGGAGATLDPVSLMVVAATSPGGAQAGGTHASVGGASSSPIYGNGEDPSTPGGGGSYFGAGFAGNGGGVLRMTAETLVLNGELRANGGNGTGGLYGGGGGAGGSINVTVRQFSGAGSLQANGGAAGNVFWGGAGRIKVLFDSSTFVGTWSALQGDGDARGTVHVLDRVKNELHVYTPVTLSGGEVYDSVVLGAGANLTLAGRVTVRAPIVVAAGTTVTVAHARALEQVTISNVVDGTLRVLVDATLPSLRVRGRLVVNARLALTTLDTEAGAIITHAAAVTTMHLVVAQRFTLAVGATLTAVGMGYAPGFGTAATASYGVSVNPSTAALGLGSAPGSGGSHAGLGGGPSPAALFDRPDTPLFCGGGGGGGTDLTSWYAGGAGGGVLRVTTNEFVLDGTVTVDGATAERATGTAGCGAGGAIIVVADILSGRGTLSARGGASLPTVPSGGGGIINLTVGTSTFSGTTSVGGGGGMLPGGAGVLVETTRPIAPKIVSTPPVQVKSGEMVDYLPRATGAPPLSWSLVSGPPAAAVDTLTGRLTWDAGAALQPAAFSLQAQNTFGADVQTFWVSVVAAPVITSQPRLSTVPDLAYSYDADGRVEASGTGPISWSLPIAPTSARIDPVTGELHWVPRGVGSYGVCVLATNAAGSGQQCFSVAVALEGQPDAGATKFGSTPSTTATCGAPYRYSGEGRPALAGEGPFTFSLVAVPGATLPEGLSIDAVTGEFSWTPRASQEGAHPLVLRAEGPAGRDEQLFAIVVDCPANRTTKVGCACGADSFPGALLGLWCLVRRRRRYSAVRRYTPF